MNQIVRIIVNGVEYNVELHWLTVMQLGLDK